MGKVKVDPKGFILNLFNGSKCAVNFQISTCPDRLDIEQHNSLVPRISTPDFVIQINLIRFLAR